MPRLPERGLTDDQIRAAVASMTEAERAALLVELIGDFKRYETLAVAVSLRLEKRTGGRLRRVDPLTVEMTFGE